MVLGSKLKVSGKSQFGHCLVR